MTVKVLPYWLALVVLGLGSALTSCRDACEGVSCAPCTLEPGTVRVAFDLDSAGRGFRQAELRGAYIVRYKRPGFTLARDTVRRQVRPNGSLSNGFDRYQLSLAELRWPSGIANVPDTLMAHNYRVVLPAASRQYDFSNLEISIAIGTSGCCNCPANVRRRLLLNGQPVLVDGGGDKTIVVLQR